MASTGVVWSVVADERLRTLGREDLTDPRAAAVAFLVGIGATLVVGLALFLRTRNPVGPLFLVLGLSMVAAVDVEHYTALALLAEPGRLPATPWLVYADEAMFIPWLLVVALVMLVIPTGRLPHPRWRLVVGVVVVSAVVLAVTRSLLPGHFGAPYEAFEHPLESSSPALPVIRALAGTLLSVSPLVAAASLVLRYRQADGEERQQLRWVGFGACVAFVALLVTAVAAGLDAEPVVAVSSCVALAVLPVSTGVAISRHRLFDLDRLVSRSVTWLLVMLILVGAWAVVVLLASAILSSPWDSPFTASLATLVAAGCARPVLTHVTDRVDRRLRRRRYDALHRVRSYVGRAAGATVAGGIQRVMAEAVGDPELTVSYWLTEEDTWVDSHGSAVEPRTGAIPVERDGQLLAVVESGTDRDLLADVCRLALPEIEATQLRAALRLRIAEITASRARIATVADRERVRLERDLHDGAQQRLLAVLFALEAAHRRSSGRAQEPLAEALVLMRAALGELRDLAHGLRPVDLDLGLAVALAGLAQGAAVPTHLECSGLPPEPPESVATVAYYAVAETLSNIGKHAAAASATVTVRRTLSELRIRVADDGCGGASATGFGLRGLADRAEAIGGSLTVHSPAGAGTEVEVVLPCG